MNEDSDDKENSKVYFMAYELLKQEDSKKAYMYANEDFWLYRPTITFDLMKLELKNTTKSDEFRVLKKFSELVLLLFF